MEIKIDAEFASLLPPLSTEELDGLEKGLLKDGCLNPLVVWQGQDILVDGHNRYSLCQKHGVDYQTQEIEFGSREEAMCWIYHTQLSRRNLNPQNLMYCRGRHYELNKLSSHRPNNVRKMRTLSMRTCKQLGQLYGVDGATIRRDGLVSRAIDSIGAVSSAAKQKLLTGEVKASKKTLVKLACAPPEVIQRVAKQVEKGTFPKSPLEEVPAPDEPVQEEKSPEYYASIQQHVAELKNPDLDRTCSMEDYFSMLDSHVRACLDSFHGLGPQFYPEVFQVLSPNDKDRILTIIAPIIESLITYKGYVEGEPHEKQDKGA